MSIWGVGKMGSLVRQYWITTLLWLIVAILVAGREAKGRVASLKHFNAAAQGQDCAIYRAVVRRTNTEIEETKRRLSEQIEISKLRRADLVACASAKGVVKFRDEQDEALAAEVCGPMYGSWVASGYRARIAQEDLEAAQENLQTLEGYLQFSCRELPKQSALSGGLQGAAVEATNPASDPSLSSPEVSSPPENN